MINKTSNKIIGFGGNSKAALVIMTGPIPSPDHGQGMGDQLTTVSSFASYKKPLLNEVLLKAIQKRPTSHWTEWKAKCKTCFFKFQISCFKNSHILSHW